MQNDSQTGSLPPHILPNRTMAPPPSPGEDSGKQWETYHHSHHLSWQKPFCCHHCQDLCSLPLLCCPKSNFKEDGWWQPWQWVPHPQTPIKDCIVASTQTHIHTQEPVQLHCHILHFLPTCILDLTLMVSTSIWVETGELINQIFCTNLIVSHYV